MVSLDVGETGLATGVPTTSGFEGGGANASRGKLRASTVAMMRQSEKSLFPKNAHAYISSGLELTESVTRTLVQRNSSTVQRT